jgi:hypothetical protein
VWWAITAVIAVAVLWPIWNSGIEWPFQVQNILFVVALVTLARHIFMLKYSLFGRHQVIKVALILASFPFLFALISYLNEFMIFMSDQQMKPYTEVLEMQEQRSIETYIWNEMLFFGVGSIMSTIILDVRLFISVWRQRNGRE